ncbi:MAG: TonB-dependent receptor plug domain-containing protein, partial [Bacteroidota bacterium]
MNKTDLNYLMSGKSFFALLLVLVGTLFSVQAQQAIQGRVVDASTAEPIEGASVLVMNSTVGAITDAKGAFSLEKVMPSDVLTISFLGYEKVTVEVGNQTFISVSLQAGEFTLNEVSVTALGIKRESKSLGYAVQQVDGEDIQQVRTPNLLNNLTGKVAGVNITQGGSGVGSTARIVIRGESSLSGDNQPLFVVNGIPISNANGGNGRAQGNLEADYGNGAADISPDDVESVTILRGANATALYGSRAANGVVLITTKSGRGSEGFSVSVNSSVTMENPLRIPQYQNDYGQGAGFNFAFVDGFGAGTNDNIDESWGPALDGRMMIQHNSTNSEGLRAGDFALRPDGYTDQASYAELPWVPQPDNIANFFETGITTTNNVSLAGASENSNFRLSFSNLYSEGILPNTDLFRNGINLDMGHDMLDDKLHINANINYINSGSNNRPNNSYGTENIMYLWVWFGRHIPMETLEDYWQPGLEGI